MPLQEKPKGYRRWTGTAILLCLCFVAGSILFLAQMGHQYNDESLLYLENAVRQHETALVKQVDGDFQTLHGVSVFVAEQDITDLEQLARLVGEVNEGNAFTCMGFATAEGRLELMELGGRRYRNLDVSREDFLSAPWRGRTSSPPPSTTPSARGNRSTTTPCRCSGPTARRWASSARSTAWRSSRRSLTPPS